MKLGGDLVDMIDKKLAFLYILEIVAAILCIAVSMRVLGNSDIVKYNDLASFYAKQSTTYIEVENDD